MSFHLLGFHGSVLPGGGSLVYTELPPIQDPRAFISPGSNRFLSSTDGRVLAVYAGAANAWMARLYTPWKPLNHVRPVSQSTTPGSPPNLATFAKNPIEIPAGHEIIFDGAAVVVAPTDMYGLAWFATRERQPRPRGEVLTILAQALSPAVPGQWTEVSPVFWETALPAGEWGIVGSYSYSTNSIAHRLILEGSADRPGGLSLANLLGAIPHEYSTSDGPLGLWGTFRAPVMPRFEVLCTAADSGVLFWLQVVRL